MQYKQIFIYLRQNYLEMMMQKTLFVMVIIIEIWIKALFALTIIAF